MKTFENRKPYVIVFLFVLAFILVASVFVQCQTVQGNVVHIFDGDTVQFRLRSGKYYRVRLQGIDAPELRQTYGTECREILRTAVAGKTVTILFYGADTYKRMLAMMFTATIPNINLYMIEQGCAWEYSAPISLKTAYQTAEATARATPVGLWMDACPTEPWAFRASGYNQCE